MKTHFSTEDTQMTSEHMKRSSTSFVIRGKTKPQWDTTSYLEFFLKKISIDKGVEKWELSMLLVGMENGASGLENSLTVP